jgi:hypothetical protein
VVVLRCTQKLLKRLGPPVEVIEPSTNALGDWFATPLSVGHQRFILLISERSRLPVLMPGRDVKHLAKNFPGSLAHVLLELEVPPSAIMREVEASRDAVIAKTNNRSLLGTLSDFSNMLWYHMQRHDEVDLVEMALRLAHSPAQRLRPSHFPDQVTRMLLQ